MSQVELLIKHFKNENSITPVEAASVYKIRSLPRRIMDLKKLGYGFEHVWRVDGMGQRYMRYICINHP
jgi:hypothetical protein|tara:strand:+ start:2345 stop:2548 length:204 start_codon:yes stop_codon:yes gene_type:complete